MCPDLHRQNTFTLQLLYLFVHSVVSHLHVILVLVSPSTLSLLTRSVSGCEQRLLECNCALLEALGAAPREALGEALGATQPVCRVE